MLGRIVYVNPKDITKQADLQDLRMGKDRRGHRDMDHLEESRKGRSGLSISGWENCLYPFERLELTRSGLEMALRARRSPRRTWKGLLLGMLPGRKGSITTARPKPAPVQPRPRICNMGRKSGNMSLLSECKALLPVRASIGASSSPESSGLCCRLPRFPAGQIKPLTGLISLAGSGGRTASDEGEERQRKELRA